MRSDMTLIVDVDGVLTDGTFWYTEEGKVAKRFGPDDNEALGLLRKYMDIVIVSGDKRGWDITKSRIDDMGFQLQYVPGGRKRLDWIKERYDPAKVIYIGDGLKDWIVFEGVEFAICTADALEMTQDAADCVLFNDGGHRAVAEAVDVIGRRYLDTPLPRMIQEAEQ